ncbi:hypothetical protein [Aeromonas hydrophila]|uniref:hypothetical protein n=1 Tax=Aeromonas hydrophila TaxID=644 RepID=UPI002B49C53E|nr:hypothetical protein [Aeromonas hydrophila]
MECIDFNGQKIFLNIIHHDSGEEPESSCVNRMISIKIGEKTYQRMATDPREVSQLVHHAAADTLLRNAPLPHTLTVVVTSFAKAFDIEWSAVTSTYAGN